MRLAVMVLLNRIFESILRISRSSKLSAAAGVRRQHHRIRMIQLLVLTGGAASTLAACSNQPQPQLFFGQQLLIEKVSGTLNSADVIETPPSVQRLYSSEEGWGLYSGARGQTTAPSSQTSTYQGFRDPAVHGSPAPM
jgi:hypothetical protein